MNPVRLASHSRLMIRRSFSASACANKSFSFRNVPIKVIVIQIGKRAGPTDFFAVNEHAQFFADKFKGAVGDRTLVFVFAGSFVAAPDLLRLHRPFDVIDQTLQNPRLVYRDLLSDQFGGFAFYFLYALLDFRLIRHGAGVAVVVLVPGENVSFGCRLTAG